MTMAIQILLLLAGLALIVFGADWLVDGASAIARRLGISEFVIGLTIVGFGTSCPELVVSLTGAFQGNADISVGNVVGSNIFNTLLILGLTAVLAPVAVTRSNSRRDIPICLLVTFIFAFLGIAGGGLTRWEGIAFLLIFAGYMFYCFKTDTGSSAGDEPAKERSLWMALLLVAAGLGGLIAGGNLFVDMPWRSPAPWACPTSSSPSPCWRAAPPCPSSRPASWPPPRRRTSWPWAMSWDPTSSTSC